MKSEPKNLALSAKLEVLQAENKALRKENEVLQNTLSRHKTLMDRFGEGTEGSDRKEIKKRLLDQKQRLHDIINGTNIGTWEWNVQTGETIFNERWANIIGYTREELQPISIESWKKFVHPDDFEASTTLLKRHFNGELEFYEYECRMKHKDGSWVWVFDRGKVATWDDTGNPLWMYGTHQDITDRKREEQELRIAKERAEESERRLNEAQQLAKLGNWELDLINNKLVWSDEIYRIFNRHPQEFEATYEAFLNYIHPEDRELVHDAYMKHISTQEPYEIVHRILLPDGMLKYVSERCTSVFDVQGHALVSKGTVADVTERLKAEQQIRLSNKLYRLRSMIAKAFVIEKERDVFANVLNELLDTLKCQFGYFGFINQEGDLVCPSITLDVWEKCRLGGKSIVFPRSEWTGLWGDSLKQKKTLFQNGGLKVPDGHVELQNALLAPVMFSGDVIGQVVLANKGSDFDDEDLSTITEITEFLAPLLHSYLEEERIKLELIRAKDRAESANRAKDDFLAMMSHEMRTPLNPIMGYVSLIQMQPESPPDPEYIDIIMRSSRRLLNLIDSLLNFSRLQKQIVQVKNSEFNLRAVIDESIRSIQLTNNGNNLILSNDSTGEYLSCGDDIRIITDKDIISQLLDNLISNACKYTDNGKIFIRYKLRKDLHGMQRLRVEIEDTGIGIPEEKLGVIFDPFVQADTSMTRSYEGAGLGLAICKKLVEILSGDIDVESELEKGSRFWFEVPVRVPGLGDFAEEMISSTKLRKFVEHWKILVVEDQEDNCSYIETLIHRLGGNVTVAKDGMEAMQAIEKESFDLVLMDLRMPVMDGIQAARLIRSGDTQNRVPILAVSAHQKEEVKEKALSVGMNGYLNKPLSPEILADTVNRLLRIKSR